MAFSKAFRNQFISTSFSMLDGEEKIVKNATGGEASAFGILYDHYQPKIYRFVLIKVGQREEAEDITHQVFLSAWQSIGDYRHLGHPFSSWLYQIARNQVIDYYRTNKNEVRLDHVNEENLAHVAPPHAQAEKNFELKRVMAAIRKLKPEYQDVVIMRFVEELTIKEVAAALKKSEAAVKLIQHRAIKQLKNLLP